MNTNLDYIFSLERPWIYIGLGEPERKEWNASAFYSKPGLDVCVRCLRGHKMRTTQALMNEFAAAFQFFEDFGENWLALQECLDYLDEWLPAQAYILVIERAEEMLLEEDISQLAALLKTIHDVGEWWSKPIISNERFNRKAIPFHSLIHFSKIDASSFDWIMRVANEATVPIRTRENPDNLGTQY